MSKTLAKHDFFGEFRRVQKNVATLGKTVRITSKLLEIPGASSKSSKEIDEEVIIAFGEESPEELNGVLISDPVNHYILVRMASVWKKTKME